MSCTRKEAPNFRSSMTSRSLPPVQTRQQRLIRSSPPRISTTLRQSGWKPWITLTVTLDFQSQFAQHQLGRFRLSVTSAKQPHDSQKPPANILAILAVAPQQRTDQQRSDLRKFFRTSISPVAKKMGDEVG